MSSSISYKRIFRKSSLVASHLVVNDDDEDLIVALSKVLSQSPSKLSDVAINIPNLSYLFSTFDPLNEYPSGQSRHEPINTKDWELIESTLPLANGETIPISEFIHLKQYLNCLSFTKDSFKVQNYDAIFYAIISFMLRWPLKILKKFDSPLAGFVAQEKKNSAHIFKLVVGTGGEKTIVPYTLSTFRLYRQFFDSQQQQQQQVQPLPKFDLMAVLNDSFIDELRNFYASLRAHANGTKLNWTSQEIASLEDYRRESPFKSEAARRLLFIEPVRRYYDQYGNNCCIKYITGQACVGKSSLVRHLTSGKYNLVSRGDLGGFSAKSHCPLSVSGLYYSLNWALRHKNIIGDRGCFDNNVWRAIQEYVDPRYEGTLVDDLLHFFANWLNVPIINAAREERVVIIIDPYIHHCRRRMLSRAEDGDLLRARIKNYNIVQIMAYYIGARLFSWPVVCVPYVNTATGVIDDAAYSKIAQEIEKFFENKECKWVISAAVEYPGNSSNVLPHLKFNKPVEAFNATFDYAKQRSIYK